MKKENLLGIDISSKEAVVKIKRSGKSYPVATFVNDAPGHKKLIRCGVAGGSQFLGMTSVDLVINSGSKTNFDFSPANSGTFDIICNDTKVGTLTVVEAG